MNAIETWAHVISAIRCIHMNQLAFAPLPCNCLWNKIAYSFKRLIASDPLALALGEGLGLIWEDLCGMIYSMGDYKTYADCLCVVI